MTSLEPEVLEAAIRADLWPADIHAIVDAVNAASDDNDMSTEQCIALGILLNRRSVTSQASEGEVVAWEWWSAGRPDIKRVQHSKPGLVPNRQMRPLYASPVSKRVERLETDMERIRVLCESEDGDQTEAVYEIALQALQGGRS